MASKLGIVRSLDGLIDDSIYNSQGVEVELNTLGGTIGNLVVLLHEVVEELDLLDMCQVKTMLGYLQRGHSDYKIVSITSFYTKSGNPDEAYPP